MALFHELAGTLTGIPGERPPLVLVHGLTFDRRQWAPLVGEIQAIDPGRQVLTLDLPAHGESGPQRDYHVDTVADALHAAVTAAGLTAPVLVGHSIGGIFVTGYAGRYPARGVLNLDQPLLPGRFGPLIREAEPTLHGPGWRGFWDLLVDGMGIPALPEHTRALVEQTARPSAELLLGYWDEIMHTSEETITEQRRADLTAIAAQGIEYHWLSSYEPDPAYASWLTEVSPGVVIHLLPGGHFPHLEYPADLAKLLA
jgi:pimeloyl-ACP methyl ester carboxylesterase